MLYLFLLNKSIACNYLIEISNQKTLTLIHKMCQQQQKMYHPRDMFYFTILPEKG